MFEHLRVRNAFHTVLLIIGVLAVFITLLLLALEKSIHES